MSERFNPQDVAVARQLREVEVAHDAAIRASASLMVTVLDATKARRLPSCASHDLISHVSSLLTGAVAVRKKGIGAHEAASKLGTSLGLPITSWGDTCQDFFITGISGHQAA